MRKIGAILGITVLALFMSSPLPAAAYGIHLGPFYFHVPFVGHHHRHRLQMRAKEEPNKGSRGSAAKTQQAEREARIETNTQALGIRLISRSSRSNRPSIRQLIRRRHSMILNRLRRRQAISSNRRAQAPCRSLQ